MLGPCRAQVGGGKQIGTQADADPLERYCKLSSRSGGIRVTFSSFVLFATPRSFEQDPYLVVKWGGGQEVRTSTKRDSGKECSWPKEELALIVRTKKQLQEPVEIEVSEPPRSSFPGLALFSIACLHVGEVNLQHCV